MANDIKVQHYTANVGADGETLTLNAAVGSLDNAFVLNLSNRHTGTGKVGDTGTHHGDDMSVIPRLSGTSTVTFDRPATEPALEVSVSFAVVEYTGSAGGANEFIVRSRDTIDLTSTLDATATLDSTPTAIADCVPFITGAMTADTAQGGDGLAVLAFLSSTATLNVHGSVNDANAKSVHVTTVEFTGSAWSVGHGRKLADAGDTGTIDLVADAGGTSGAAFDVGDWATAFIADWGNADAPSHGSDDWSPEYSPGSATDEVDWQFKVSHNGALDHMVHVVKHADLAVTRYSWSTSSPALTVATDITSASLTSTATAVATISANTSNATTYARGWRVIELDSVTQVTDRCSNTGGASDAAIQVVDFEAIETAAVTATATAAAAAGSAASASLSVSAGTTPAAAAGLAPPAAADIGPLAASATATASAAAAGVSPAAVPITAQGGAVAENATTSSEAVAVAEAALAIGIGRNPLRSEVTAASVPTANALVTVGVAVTPRYGPDFLAAQADLWFVRSDLELGASTWVQAAGSSGMTFGYGGDTSPSISHYPHKLVFDTGEYARLTTPAAVAPSIDSGSGKYILIASLFWDTGNVFDPRLVAMEAGSNWFGFSAAGGELHYGHKIGGVNESTTLIADGLTDGAAVTAALIIDDDELYAMATINGATPVVTSRITRNAGSFGTLTTASISPDHGSIDTFGVAGLAFAPDVADIEPLELLFLHQHFVGAVIGQSAAADGAGHTATTASEAIAVPTVAAASGVALPPSSGSTGSITALADPAAAAGVTPAATAQITAPLATVDVTASAYDAGANVSVVATPTPATGTGSAATAKGNLGPVPTVAPATATAHNLTSDDGQTAPAEVALAASAITELTVVNASLTLIADNPVLAIGSAHSPGVVTPLITNVAAITAQASSAVSQIRPIVSASAPPIPDVSFVIYDPTPFSSSDPTPATADAAAVGLPPSTQIDSSVDTAAGTAAAWFASIMTEAVALPTPSTTAVALLERPTLSLTATNVATAAHDLGLAHDPTVIITGVARPPTAAATAVAYGPINRTTVNAIDALGIGIGRNPLSISVAFTAATATATATATNPTIDAYRLFIDVDHLAILLPPRHHARTRRGGALYQLESTTSEKIPVEIRTPIDPVPNAVEFATTVGATTEPDTWVAGSWNTEWSLSTGRVGALTAAVGDGATMGVSAGSTYELWARWRPGDDEVVVKHVGRVRVS